MANANTNIMSINISPSAGSTTSSSGNSKLGYKSSQKGGNDFNSALDRANNTLNRQAAPVQQNPSDAEEVSYSDAATKNPDAPVEAKATNQGKNNQKQDANQNATQNQAAESNVPAEIDTKNVLNDEKIAVENILPNVEIKPDAEISDAVAVENVLPFMFNANTETLLPSQNTENTGEVNLMAVVPQSNESKGQEMLNILSGKTWTAEDVKATLTAQNSQSAEVNPDALNLQQNGKNFTFNTNQNANTNTENQPQIFTRQNTLTPEQPANLNQPTNLNQSANLNQNINLNPEQSPQVQTQTLNAEETLQPTVQRQVEMQQQPILNSMNPQVEPKQNNQFNQMLDLFNGNLQVENENAPLSPIQETLRQQPEQNQQQSFSQNPQMTSQDSNAEVQTQNVGGEETFVQNVTPANNNVSTPQNVTQTPTPEANAQAAREADIPAQIVQQARLIRTAENTEMVINLKPEHLGQLTLRVSVSQNGAVNASFYSDNAQVRAAIENSIVQLKQELSDQGLKVDNVQVSSYLSDGGLMNGQGGQAWQQQQQQSNSRRIDFDSMQDEIDAVTPETETDSADGVDYKI